MATARSKVRKHRTLWISDVHLGSKGCQARRLIEFLRSNDCEELFLNGDIFDGWKLKSHFYWPPEHSRVIREVISKARRGTRVYYIAGNHDDFLRQFIRGQMPLGYIRLANEVVHTTADGRRLLVMHGDAYDEVVSGMPLLARVADVGYEMLMRSDQLLNLLRQRRGLAPLPFSATVKTQIKAAVQYLSGFDEKVVYRCRREGLQGVMCGHTHHAEIRYLSHGITSYNSGDWVESCTALAEDFKGNISLLKMEKEDPLQRRAEEAEKQRRRQRLARRSGVLPKIGARMRRQLEAPAPIPAQPRRERSPATV